MVFCKAFRLPPPSALYRGREGDALDIVDCLKEGNSAVCLLADAGMGKSSLALDVGGAHVAC